MGLDLCRPPCYNESTMPNETTYHPVRAWLIQHGQSILWLAEQIGEHPVALTMKLAPDPNKRRTLMEDEVEAIAKVIEMSAEYIKGPNVTLTPTTPEPA